MTNIKKIGLVCEGGGQRIVHTAGILDFFLENKLHFPYVIGVSAGASNSLSYVSRQVGRNRTIDIDFAKDRRYSSFGNFLRNGSVFGMEFLFDKLPNHLVPFDYETYFNSSSEHVIGITHCETGKTDYYYKKNIVRESLMDITIASCSLPFMGKIKSINGKNYLDGGISDPIPIRKAIEDGYDKNVVLLSQKYDYRKEPFKNFNLLKKFFKGYEGIEDIMNNRHNIYNETLDYLKELEEDGKVFIFRPKDLLKVGRTTKDSKKLERLYNQGYSIAKEKRNAMMEWMNDFI